MDLDLLRVIEGDGMQGLSALAWLGGGHLVCSSFDRTVRVWDTNTSAAAPFSDIIYLLFYF